MPPACPDDLSLPQYANLLYGRTCFVCHAISLVVACLLNSGLSFAALP